MSGLNGRQFVDKYFKFIIFYGNCDSNITEDCSWDPFFQQNITFSDNGLVPNRQKAIIW